MRFLCANNGCQQQTEYETLETQLFNLGLRAEWITRLRKTDTHVELHGIARHLPDVRTFVCVNQPQVPVSMMVRVNTLHKDWLRFSCVRQNSPAWCYNVDSNVENRR